MTITAHFPEGPRPAASLSPAVSAGSLVFTSGQVGVDRPTGTVPEDIGGQTRATFTNLVTALTAAGVTLADVVKTTVFLTDAADLAGMDAAYREHFGDVLPARSTVTVAALARPEFRIEIEAVALRPE